MSSTRPLSSLVPFVEGGCHNYHGGGDGGGDGDGDGDVNCLAKDLDMGNKLKIYNSEI